MTTLAPLDRNAVRARQEATYRDPDEWWESTPVAASSRLRCVLRYLTIIERAGVRQPRPGLKGGFRLLEPACGVGSLSSLLALFAEVASFDLSPEAIRQARAMFGHQSSLALFEGDGTQPERLPQLAGQTFDVILLKEFVPLARHMIGGRPPLEIVRAYHALLRPGGVLILEHALPIGAWRRNEAILQTAQIRRALDGRLFCTLALDVAHLLVPGLGRRQDGLVSACARALGPLAAAYCWLRRINLSKTMVIQKPDAG